jgi:uncharacterized protein YdeI (YjbR/CyaY-like superfamily)
MGKSSAKEFKATLRPDNTSLKWTVVSVPRSLLDGWRITGQPRVKGEINGFAFRSSLFSTGKGDFLLIVNKRMQKGAEVTLGSVASFRIEPDTDERTVTTPAELKKAFAGMASLRKWYDNLPYSFHKYVADAVNTPKSAEARQRQAEKMAEVLLAMKEGELETPPILEAAFNRAPLARQGWSLMTEAQRRGHLWGIFYYQSPESRQKRAAKAIDEARRIAKRKL